MAIRRLATDRSNTPLAPILAKLSGLASLSDHEIGLINTMASHRRQHRAGAELEMEGHALGRPRVVLSGWACRARLFEDGRRQIIHILLPGDGIGLCRRPSPHTVSTVIALTSVQTGEAQALADVLAEEDDASPGLLDALEISAGIEEAALVDQVARLGRLTAYERTVHLLLELHWRLTLAGLADRHNFPMPLTQEMLADTLGLSIVHVNRTLQQLRREGMLELRSGYCDLLKPDLLAALCGYRSPRPSRTAHFGAAKTA